MKNLTDLDLQGQRVLIRVDYNVPLEDGEVVNDFRIQSSLPTIKYCIENGASVVLMSHLGRPKGKIIESMSLSPVAFHLEELLKTEVMFSDDCISDEAISLSKSMKKGEVHLLENLRFYEGETKNVDIFAKKLAQHADIFINDAFGTAHRAHASNVGVVSFMKETAIGFLMQKEWKYLSESLKTPNKPYAVIMGGAKISGKIELIEQFIDSADFILIGGAMAFTFLKAQGKNVGGSLVDDENIKIATSLLEEAKSKNVQIILPCDVVASPELDEASPWRVATIDELDDDEMGFDIGPETCMNYSMILDTAQTVVWNGPMGVFEIPAFATGTQEIASTLQFMNEDGHITIIGGGDTATALESCGMNEGFSHISTGGGASLELLSGKQLPAFEVLK
jgi:3-phosphoglycerate kinase